MNPKRVWKVVNDLKFVRTWWRGGLGGGCCVHEGGGRGEEEKTTNRRKLWIVETWESLNRKDLVGF